MLDYLASIWPR